MVAALSCVLAATAAFQYPHHLAPRGSNAARRVSATYATEFAPISEIIAAQKGATRTARSLAAAVAKEDYAAAARLSAELKAQRSADPLYTLRGELAKAIAVEDFSAASALQSQLKRLRETRPGLLWRNELLVLTAGGQSLVLLSGDGDPDAPPRVLYTARSGTTLQQPCWSPCGDRVAVSEVDPSGNRSRVLVVSASDGAELASAPTPPVFFIYYSPAGDVVTFLHAEPNLAPGGPSIVLGALDVASGKARYVAPGGPLYYALSTLPGAILMHNGFLSEVTYSSHLLQRDDGTRRTLSAAPGGFRAPCLLGEAAEHACFVEKDGSLVAVALASGERATLHSLGGGDALLVSAPDARSLLAVHAVQGSGGTWAQELLLLQAASPAELVAPQISLRLTAPSCRIAHRLDAKAAAATLCAFFSPDGRAFDPFVPSTHFLQTVLPFFDQYALASCTPWSPDSSSWCYAMADGAVKVQNLDEAADTGADTAPKELGTNALGLAEGVLAAPSPEQLAWAAQLGLLALAPDAETREAPEADLVLWSPC